jgi:signal transduction histidine kinase
LHDKLLQGFLAASLLLHQAVKETPADSPSMPALSRALRLVRQAIDEGRAAIRGVHQASPAGSSLEHALSNLLSEMTTERDQRLNLRPGSPGLDRTTTTFLIDGNINAAHSGDKDRG